MKTKIFTETDHLLLEKKINEWLDTLNKAMDIVHSVHYSTTLLGAYVRYSCLVVYKQN